MPSDTLGKDPKVSPKAVLQVRHLRIKL